MDRELEEFEDDFKKVSDGGFEDLDEHLIDNPADGDEVDDTAGDDDGDSIEDPSEDEVDDKPDDKPTDGEDEDKPPDQDEDPPVQYVTLPEDADTFGELAGKRITYEQLQEAKLVDKLVTWGHQGRHMVQRNQEELEESKKIRALLEEQLGIVKADRERASEAPPLPPDQAADALVGEYSAEFEALGKAGAIEDAFFETYPKVAVQIEHRFRATRDLAEVLIKQVDELKTLQGQRVEQDTTEASKTHLSDVMGEVAKSNKLFDGLTDDESRKEFMTWATGEESTLNWVDKESNLVTPADISASYLLYLHENPDKVVQAKPDPKKKAAEKKLASGGNIGTNTKSKSVEDLDEFQKFEKDYKESRTQGVEY